MAEKIQMWDDLKKSALEHQCHPRPGTLPAERDLARCGRQPRGRFLEPGLEGKLNVLVIDRDAASVAFNLLEVLGKGAPSPPARGGRPDPSGLPARPSPCPV